MHNDTKIQLVVVVVVVVVVVLLLLLLVLIVLMSDSTKLSGGRALQRALLQAAAQHPGGHVHQGACSTIYIYIYIHITLYS